MIAYEQRLKQNLSWGFEEGSLHFEKASAVHRSLQKTVREIEELEIPYAIVGAMAMFAHGYERFTSHVDLLVTKEGLAKIHERLEGRGYLPPFQGSKQLRDTDTGVKIEFLTTGDYPGDGKPKPIAFPNPAEASTKIDGIDFLRLPTLLELKLASGMTNPGRLKDLADVQEMIRVLKLPREFADQLHPFVRDKFGELWVAVRDNSNEA